MKLKHVFSLILSFCLCFSLVGGAEEASVTMPGKPSPVFDEYDSDARSPNPLYFTSLPEKPWWNNAAGFRLPVLITEPVGLSRQAQPVSVFHEFPKDTSPDSIHVVTPYGKEIPSQIKVLDKEKNLIEVVFLFTLKGEGQEPLFIYYGVKPIKTETDETTDELLMVRKTDRALLVSNNRLTVDFNRISGTDGVQLFRGIKPHGAEYNQIGHVGNVEALPNGTEVKLVEDGPIRKTVACGDSALYSVYACSPLVCYSRKRLSRTLSFLPGGDTVNDTLYYESTNGLMAVPINYSGGNTPPVTYKLAPFVKEGWYAFHDYDRNEVIGEFFDLPVGRLKVMTIAWGYWGTWNSGPLHGAIYCERDPDIGNCRDTYIAWKNPMLVSVGIPEQKRDIVPKVPVLGEDFILMHLVLGKIRLNAWDETSAGRWVNDVKEFGGNYGMHWSHRLGYNTSISTNVRPEALKDIIAEAHRQGVGVSFGHNVHGSPVIARELAEIGVDCVWLSDEWSWTAKELTPEETTEFKKMYGMDPPSPLLTEDLTDPAQYSLFLYRMYKTTKIHAELAEPARKVNPNMLITQTTSPNNLAITKERSPQDLVALGEIQTALCMDLYTTFPSMLAPCIKTMRGATGNLRPFLDISGYCGWDARKPVELNQYLQLFYGANALAYFIMERVCNPAPALGARDAYNFIDYTGLGKRMAGAHPMQFVGILRDRAEFLDSVKRGEYTLGQPSAYYAKIKQYILALGNIPSDVVYSKYAKLELITPYKVIIVPNNPVLSDDLANVLVDYVKAGGSLIVEGETIDNPIIADIAGLKKAGGKEPVETEIKGSDSLLAGMSFPFIGSCVRAKPSDGCRVLATDSQGGPLVTLASCGKGKVVHIAPVIGLQVNDVDGLRICLQKLVEDLAGYVPFKTDPEDASSSVLLNGHVSGSDHIVAAYNQSARDRMDFTLRLKGFSSDIDSMMSIRNGTIIPLKNGVSGPLTLAPNEVDFYVLGTESSLHIPNATLQTNVPISQALVTGMTFLNQDVKAAQTPGKQRKKEPDVIYVGIFKTSKDKLGACEMGAQAMYDGMAGLPKVKMELIGDLEPATIAFYDVVIVPNVYDFTPITDNWESNIREYVENGGGAMLIHHAVGYRECSDATLLFPEVGVGTDFAPITRMELVEDHPIVTSAAFHERFKSDLDNPAFAQTYREPVMKKGDIIDTGFPDYIVIKTGKDGVIVARSVRGANKGGTPSIVIGEVGKGRVVISGMDIGCRMIKVSKDAKFEKNVTKFEEGLTKGEKNILVNSIYWLGEERDKK